jgi:hypothetical protein
LDWMEKLSWVINKNGEYYIKWINWIWDCSHRRRERGCNQDLLPALYHATRPCEISKIIFYREWEPNLLYLSYSDDVNCQSGGFWWNWTIFVLSQQVHAYCFVQKFRLVSDWGFTLRKEHNRDNLLYR